MSSLFQDFTDSLFKVNKTISQNANADPNDVLKTKKALTQTGDYQAPDFGITDIPDRGMIDGLKSFQQINGLTVDGVMKPNGPTESKINETVQKMNNNADSPECIELKKQYIEARSQAKTAWDEYQTKLKDAKDISNEARDALNNLKSLLPKKVLEILFGRIKNGSPQAGLDKIKDMIDDAKEWGEIVDAAWTLYNSLEKEKAEKKQS